MAAKRMFAKAVIQSARFLRLPQSSQLLYFFLGLEADDDGFVEAFAVLRLYGMQEADLEPLIERNFIRVVNDDLTAFIVDWKVNNYIQKDRYKPSIYHGLLERLETTTAPDTGCIQSVSNTDTQTRVRLE